MATIAVLESRIDGHEKVCEERYDQLKKRLWRLEMIFFSLSTIIIGQLIYVIVKMGGA